MKRLILLAAVAFFALPAAAQMQEAFPSYIQVNGRAEKEIAPDEFYLQIIINERDSKGKISVESQQRDMIAALKRAGVDVEKQLKMANLKVSHSKIEQYKAEVRVEAMQNARQSAATLAEAIGQKIGKCFYIYDSNNNVMPVFYDNMAVMRSAKAMGVAEDAAADEPLDFKTIKLQYNVQAKFVLE